MFIWSIHMKRDVGAFHAFPLAFLLSLPFWALLAFILLSCKSRPDFIKEPGFPRSCKMDIECRVQADGKELATCVAYSMTCEKVLRFHDCRQLYADDEKGMRDCLAEISRR